MNATLSFAAETGLEVTDLHEDADFAARRLHQRNAATQLSGLQRLSAAFVEQPDTILQELVNVAIDLCGADSAGISIENCDASDDNFYQWVAAAGEYSSFLKAILPRYPSACGICLQRGHAQHFRVTKRFFDILGVEAPEVLDGLLLPWNDGEKRGTIFIISHHSYEAFDREDSVLMHTLADFAAMAMRNRRQQNALVQQTSLAAAAQMADRLAHKINNPLQSLTNLVFLAQQSGDGIDARELAESVMPDLQRLTALVSQLLAVPFAANARYVRETASDAAQVSL